MEALNAVPVEFYGSRGKLKQINDAWKIYLDYHDEHLTMNDAWAQKRQDLFLDLLHLIAQFLGYSFSRAQLERDIYSPRAHGDLETEQTIIRKGLVGLFKGEIALPLGSRSSLRPLRPAPSCTEELRRLLVETLKQKVP